MPDFGSRWINPRPLDKGGQAQTFVVDDAEKPDGPELVAKILSNPRQDRKARFLQEVEVTQSFDHPNVVRSLGSGETGRSKWPYFIMPYYQRGTLEDNYDTLGTPLQRLRMFLAICEGVSYAHRKQLIHRDLKPANIFIADVGVPIVGDFGLCYRADENQEGRNTQTSEAVGARKYMPPEWREGRNETPHPTGDIYSLGKILYWMFQRRVYDGHEDDHAIEHPIVPTRRVLRNQTPEAPQRWILAKSVADELVGRTVLKNPKDRVGSVTELIDDVSAAIQRVEGDGRVLDFNLPKPCLFCATGTYQLPSNIPFPLRDKRRNPPPGDYIRGEWPFKELQSFVKGQLGFGNATLGPIPIFLVCDVCGNIQYFRLDLTSDKSGQRWNP
jgi:serine/threonine-protein kinase